MISLFICTYLYTLTKIQQTPNHIQTRKISKEMPTVAIRFINFQQLEDEQKLEVHPTTNMTELYEAIVYRLQLEYEIECPFDFKQVVFYEKGKPNKKIVSTSKVQNLTGNKKELCIIFPKDNRPIIECQFGGIQQFIYDYPKNDRLEMVLKKVKGPFSSIVHQQKFDRLVINGVDVPYAKDKNQKFQRYLEGSINSTIKIALYQQKSESPNQKEQVYVQEQAYRRQASPNRRDSNQNKGFAPQNLKVEIVPQNLSLGKEILPREQNKPQEIKVEVLSKPQVSQQKPVQIFSKKQQSIQLLLKFQAISGNGGNRQVTLDVDRSKSMQSLLPVIITYIKSNGFDWQFDAYDHHRDRDKLHIIYESSQFKKFDKSLRSLVQKQTTQLIFNIKRHYAGG